MTRVLSLPTPRRFSLTFPDRDLERQFQRQFADEAVVRFRFLAGLVVALWLIFGLFDHRMVSGNDLVLARIVRFAIVAPLLLGCVALSYAPSRIFTRFWQPALALCFALMTGAMLLFAPTLADSLRHAHASGLALVIVGGYTLVMMRFVYAVTVAGLVTVVMTAMNAMEGGPDLAGTVLNHGMIWLYLANIIGAFSCRELERFRRNQFVQRLLLQREQHRAETLLQNTLPRSVAERLKRDDGRVVDGFDEVTVLFGDLVGFTKLAAWLPPRELVELLNDLYSEFDAIAERHGLEKIKTVGDAYMVVGGAPLPRDDHATAVAAMAVEMLEVIEARRAAGDDRLSIRIGIHTGPVVAGVIGTRKLSYDVWGDTVNIASRMQSHGVPGAIQVSQTTHDRITGLFELEPRGQVELKGKGRLEAYLLVQPRRDARHALH